MTKTPMDELEELGITRAPVRRELLDIPVAFDPPTSARGWMAFIFDLLRESADDPVVSFQIKANERQVTIFVRQDDGSQKVYEVRISERRGT